METKHFFKGHRVHLDEDILKEHIKNCLTIGGLIYELSAINNISTVFETKKTDILNEKIFAYDVVFLIDKEEFVYPKLIEGAYILMYHPSEDEKNKRRDLLFQQDNKNLLKICNLYEKESKIFQDYFTGKIDKINLEEIKKTFAPFAFL